MLMPVFAASCNTIPTSGWTVLLDSSAVPSRSTLRIGLPCPVALVRVVTFASSSEVLEVVEERFAVEIQMHLLRQKGSNIPFLRKLCISGLSWRKRITLPLFSKKSSLFVKKEGPVTHASSHSSRSAGSLALVYRLIPERSTALRTSLPRRRSGGLIPFSSSG